MPSEKEFNGILFDQLDIIERIEDALKEGGEEGAFKTIEKEKRRLKRKLYQDPPLIENGE